jgi:hypothetical protein
VADLKESAYIIGHLEAVTTVNVHTRTGREDAQTRRSADHSIISLSSTLDRGKWSTPRPGRFTPGRDSR